MLYADDTTLNATVELFGETEADIQLSIRNKLQKICKCMVGSKQVASKRCKIKVHAFPHVSESNSTVTFSFDGSPNDYMTKFIFLGLTLDCNLNFESHLKIIGTKIARVIGVERTKPAL